MVRIIQTYKKEQNKEKNISAIQYFLYRHQDRVSKMLNYPVFNSFLVPPSTYLTAEFAMEEETITDSNLLDKE